MRERERGGAETQTDRQVGRHTYIHTDRQIERQTERKRQTNNWAHIGEVIQRTK